VLDALSPFLYFQSSSPAFEYPRSDPPPQVHFIGPLLPEPPRDFVPPAWCGDLQGGRPVVLVNQGTIATDPGDLIVPALRAPSGEDMLVVATTGGASADRIAHEQSSASDADQFAAEMRVALNSGVMGGFSYGYGVRAHIRPGPIEGSRPAMLPANARIAPFIPFGALLPHVDLMIANGGYGGVQFALAHGAPLIVAGATEEKARDRRAGGLERRRCQPEDQPPHARAGRRRRARGAGQRALPPECPPHPGRLRPPQRGRGGDGATGAAGRNRAAGAP
jgi:hypothetical protein